MPGGWTRRQVLRRGGAAAAGVAGLGLAGFTGYWWPHPASTDETPPAPDHLPASDGSDVDRFVTRSDIHPPVVSVSQVGGASQPPYIFIAPRGYISASIGQSGPMIVDRDGRLVWFGLPLGGTPLNFTRQEYRGKPALTWSAGVVNDAGVTTGTSYIADSSYRVIATVKAGNGAQTDLHEFNLTPQGTALITAHRKVAADLSPLGGPAKGAVLASIAQEIDVATGEVVFEWDSTGHVPLAESHQRLAGGRRIRRMTTSTSMPSPSRPMVTCSSPRATPGPSTRSTAAAARSGGGSAGRSPTSSWGQALASPGSTTRACPARAC